MTGSLEERWAAFVARGGPQLVQLRKTIAEAIAREGYLSAEQVLAMVEQALQGPENSTPEAPFPSREVGT